jgi:hypothetical protein
MPRVQKNARILKAQREKYQLCMYKDKLISKTADFSAETLKRRRAWNDIFQALKENKWLPILLYPEKVTFKTKKEMKTFQDKHKLKQFMTTKPA